MATTKVTLSLDSTALSLARGASERSESSLSAVISDLVARHILTDYAPPVRPVSPADERAEAAAAAADLEFLDTAARYDGPGRHGCDRAAG